jgi:hypothetical protein
MHVKINIGSFLYVHTRRTRTLEDLHLMHTRGHDYIDIRPHRLDVRLLDYLYRLVSTRKLVEDGSRDINN